MIYVRVGWICDGLLSKNFYKEADVHWAAQAGLLWEVDVYQGRLAGIVIAEVRLRHASEEPDLPPWIGREVTDDARFGRKSLQSLSWQCA